MSAGTQMSFRGNFCTAPVQNPSAELCGRVAEESGMSPRGKSNMSLFFQWVIA